MMRFTLVAALLCAASCNKGDALVVVTVSSSTPLSGIATLQATATIGTATRMFPVPTGGSFDLPPPRTFGIDVPDSYSGMLSLHLDARDGAGGLLAAGDGSTNVSPGHRADVTVDLTAGAGGGGDMSIGDMTMTMGDLSTGPDLQLPPDMTLTPVTHVGTSNGTTNTITGIWGTSASDIYAVDMFGGVYHSSGGGQPFNLVATLALDAATVRLNGIFGVGGALYAVGQPAAWRSTDGVHWSPVNVTPSGMSYAAVFAPDASHIWIAGTGGTAAASTPFLAMSSDGMNFASQTPSMGQPLMGIWASDANHIWATGQGGTLLTSTNGSTFGNMAPTGVGAQELWGIGGTSASDIWTGGSNGYLAHWDGTTWTQLTNLPSTISGVLFASFWAASPNDVWAAGGPHLAHWDGASWVDVPRPTLDLAGLGGSQLYTVWGTGNGEVYAGGDSGQILREAY